MARAGWFPCALGTLVLLVVAGAAAADPTPLSPEETVRRYLQALKDGRLDRKSVV